MAPYALDTLCIPGVLFHALCVRHHAVCVRFVHPCLTSGMMLGVLNTLLRAGARSSAHRAYHIWRQCCVDHKVVDHATTKRHKIPSTLYLECITT